MFLFRCYCKFRMNDTHKAHYRNQTLVYSTLITIHYFSCQHEKLSQKKRKKKVVEKKERKIKKKPKKSTFSSKINNKRRVTTRSEICVSNYLILHKGFAAIVNATLNIQRSRITTLTLHLTRKRCASTVFRWGYS